MPPWLLKRELTRRSFGRQEERRTAKKDQAALQWLLYYLIFNEHFILEECNKGFGFFLNTILPLCARYDEGIAGTALSRASNDQFAYN